MTCPTFVFTAPFGRCLTAAGLVLLLLPAGAQAGFEIRGAGIPQPPPVSGGALESNSTLAPIGMMPDAVGRPTIPVTAVPIDAPAPIDMMPAAPRTGDFIDGFGSDLPLVIALQQVAPPGYQFSFSDAVDPGSRVSWQGGRSWRDVVRDMLAPLDLTYTVRDGNVLVVTPQSAMPAPMQTAQVTPSPVQNDDTQQMRRQKPSGLLDRVKSKFGRSSGGQGPTSDWTLGEEEAPVALASAPTPVATAPIAVAPIPPAPPSALRPEERVIEPMPSPVPAAEALTMQDADLSPIELTAAPMSTTAAIVRPPAPSSEAVVTSGWQARQGDTLRDVIAAWSGRAGVDLQWSIDYDYRLSRDIDISGPYADAVAQLLDQFRKAKPRPYAQLHRRAGSTQVLVIKAYGVNE